MSDKEWFTQFRLPIDLRHKFVRVQDTLGHKQASKALETMVLFFQEGDNLEQLSKFLKSITKKEASNEQTKEGAKEAV